MNTEMLETRLKAEGVPDDMYTLTGGLPNESYCLNEADGKWEVYYSERGQKTGLEIFDREDEACERLYKLLVK